MRAVSAQFLQFERLVLRMDNLMVRNTQMKLFGEMASSGRLFYELKPADDKSSLRLAHCDSESQ